MSRLKDKFYNWAVRKNENVRYEYEKYVMEHTEEHYENRLKHWKILWKLNWHYRVKKKELPLLYFDKNIVQKGTTAQKNAAGKKNIEKKSLNPNIAKEYMQSSDFPESKVYERKEIITLSKELLEYDVISFDMFDTLIFRCFNDPKDVFWLVGNELHIPNYKVIRAAIEQELREEKANGEVTIDEIYDVISKRYDIEKEYGISLELEYEKKSCFANPYMHELYTCLKKHGKRMIVTSNMYLNKNFLQQILQECGYTQIDEIYVSCDYSISKKNGGLQKKITELIGKQKKMIHIGDNYHMDVEGSRIAGWKAIYYKNVNQIGKKYRPQKMTCLSGGIYQGLVNSKLHSGLSLNPYYEYGYAYVGYLVYGFCKWLNQLAKLEDVDKFLFVSRDMCVVEQVYKKYFNKVDSEYIKASRTSSIHLSFERHIEHFINWHVKRRISSCITISQVLNELNLEYLENQLEMYGLLPQEVLTNVNLGELKDLIYGNKDKIAMSYKTEKEAAKKYYSSKIENAKKVCIVDLGWKGSTANSLEYFLKEYCQMDVNMICALLGMEGHDFVDEMMSVNKIYSYMFSSRDNTDMMQEHNANGNIWRRIYEIIFTSNEQSLLNFTLQKNEEVDFRYLRKEVRNPEIITNIHQGIIDFANDFANQEKKLEIDFDISPRDTYKPLCNILKETEYNYELFKNFEVCFIAGDVKENNIEMFKEVVLEGGK